ncbi:vesicular integral-membrane protein VIP36-like [Tubulanus polymorphus]|uniref:vesicular integral-membrane protein VIP36-like n=1 Tax=Tubulanus polymorphus TaxID=672921 RepID=UPI003DA5298E
MASSCEFLFTFLLYLSNYCLIYGTWNTKDYLKREHTFVKPYQDNLWDFIGSTMVTNQYVRLTPDHQSKQGGLWNKHPVFVRDWEMHVHFKVHGSGKELFGDGMALWYTKERLTQGDVFGSKDYFTGLAIFLDTYSNHNGPHNHGHPYISAMINNGSLHYDHDRDGTHTELNGCESQFRNKNYDTLLAVRYTDNTLTVSTDVDDKGTWKECFKVSGIKLPTGYFIGASAATGELADNHDIVSVKFYELDITHKKDDTTDYSKIIPEAAKAAAPRVHSDDPEPGFFSGRMTGWKLLLIIILSVIGVGVCGMVGFLVYSNKQDYRSKRFY